MTKIESFPFKDGGHGTIHYDEATKTLVAEWQGSPDSDQWRAALNKGLEVFKEKAAENWVADVTNMGAVDPDDMDWLLGDWSEMIMEAGLKRLCNVVPNDVFAEMAMEAWSNNDAVEGLVVGHAKTTEEALAWLKEQP